jgi:hypothetical protein
VQNRLMEEIPRIDLEAIEEMQKRGLKVIDVEPGETLAAWKKVAESFATKMSGTIVPGDMLEKALRHRTAFRRNSLSEGSN